MQTRAAVPPLLIAFGVLVTVCEPAWAQSCGGAAGPSPGGCGAAEGSWLMKGEGSARFSAEYEVKDRSYKGKDRVANDFDETLFITRLALDVRYGITDDWSAQLILTYPHYTYRLRPPGGERVKQRFRGPGDTLFGLGRQVVFGEREHAAMTPDDVPGMKLDLGEDKAPAKRPVFVSFWAGVSLPTGEAEKPNPAIVNEDVSVANLQTGTGTFDPSARLRAEWPQDGWTPFAEVALRYPLYENRYSYQTGDTETLLVGATVPVLPKITLGLSAMYQRAGRDQFEGGDVGVGGAQWIYMIPTAEWQITGSLSLDVGVRVPVYRRTETKLSDSVIVYQAGLSLRF